MNSWKQAMCRHCLLAYKLGQGQIAMLMPVVVEVTLDPPDPCLVCGKPTKIYTRIDPEQTEGMTNAKKKP
jgi:hypothetical protein